MNKVELELKRIQTYLFASPRLRAMLGANSALGHTIRVGLPRIARDCGAKADPQTLKRMPAAAAVDPLQLSRQALAGQAILGNALLIDDPAGLYRDYGVLVRDGGHFIATFPEAEQARRFIEQAAAHITQELPGILLEARLDGKKLERPHVGESLFQHPSFQVSQLGGNRPAHSRGAKAAFVSAEEKQLEERGKTFRDNPRDLIALLEQVRLIPRPDVPPQTLEDIAGDDYLALVHADGNGIGKRYQAWRAKNADHQEIGLGAEAHGERFYHSMRVAVRRALTEALKRVFADAPQRYQLLMLGGDDLLMACAASYALPFVLAYAEELQGIDLCDGKPLTVGAGVAITRTSFPFHRLHDVAEALADSAKQRHRAEPTLGSVVDWHVTSSAWLGDPLAQRRVDSLARNAVLSGKPYPVLGARSLDTLLENAKSIGQSSSVARSQLRELVEVMRRGPSVAELSWAELPKEMGSTLGNALAHFGQASLFRPLAGGWKTSVLPDLVEIYEIYRRAGQSSMERTA